jgi:hypothetical protein
MRRVLRRITVVLKAGKELNVKIDTNLFELSVFMDKYKKDQKNLIKNNSVE